MSEKKEIQNDALFTISQKDKPPIVVTHSVGGEVVFTRAEFAVRIGVHVSTLRNWEKDGMLVPAYVDGDSVRYYTETQALQYLKTNQKWKHNSRRI